MILPKGTTEFSKNGGENVMEETIDQIRSEKKTGYILVTGSLDNYEGEKEAITAQLLFEDGEPKLCETTVNDQTRKGKMGIHSLLKSMMNPENIIEMRCKIDVGPPMAFFKECRFEPADLDIDEFKSKIKEEEEKIRQKEEERRQKVEKENSIREQVENWIGSGYKIDRFPQIMEESHDDIVKWYDGLSSSIQEIKETLERIRPIDEVEVSELKNMIIEKAKNPMLIEDIRKLKGDLEAKMGDIGDKRAEMERWVNLWKDEGYNTEKLEETLKADIETAWHNLTTFMDDIQRLKDHKEELENLRKDDPDDKFGTEIREIDLLLNDPLEIENIIKLIWGLKETMGKEKEEKEILLKNASKWEEKGYELSDLLGKMGERLDTFKNEHQSFVNNITTIEQMKDETKTLDRRDIPDEIDGMIAGWTNPFLLADYEMTLKNIKEKLEDLNSRRKSLMDEIEGFKNEGYDVSDIEKESNSPLENITAIHEDFKGKIGQLKDLSKKITKMDQRWLEERFEKLSSKLKDVSLIEEIITEVAEIQVLIDEREELRRSIRSEMEGWEGEGFDIQRLKDLIEQDINTFKPIYEDISDKIKTAKEILVELKQLNVKYFPAEEKDLKNRLHKPEEIEDTAKDVEGFKKKVTEDWDIRNRFLARMSELANSGYNIEGMEQIVDTSPNLINEKVDEVEMNVARLTTEISDIEKWDPLESNWFSEEIEKLRTHMQNIMDAQSASKHYNDLKETIASNAQSRAAMKQKVTEWKDMGFITRGVIEKMESRIEELKEAFDKLNEKMEKLQNLQERFDSLNIKHFKSEAEEIEFKMNDPYMVDGIEKEIEELESKINEDLSKRQEYKGRIKEYMVDGFMGSKKLYDFMDEDLAVVDLEFRNFDKEVQLFKKYMETTGFVFPDERKPIKEEEENVVEKKPRSEKKQKKEEGEDDGLTFEKFIKGSPNEVAFNAALDVANEPSVKYNPLLILGDEGNGKTHLLSSIHKKIKGNNPKAKVLLTNGEGFLKMMKEHKKESKMEDFRDIFRNHDILIIDDLDQLKDSEEGQEMFINIMNSYLDNDKQVIIASERDIKSIPEVADHIRVRLDTGISADLEGTTPEFNMELIRRWGGEEMNKEAMEFMANNLLGPVTHVKLALNLYLEELEKAKKDPLGIAKEILERISGEPDQSKLTEELQNELDNILDGKKKEETVVCTNCDKEIPADSKKCPSCGAIFDDEEMKECPVCKGVTEMDSKVCPNCSFEFK